MTADLHVEIAREVLHACQNGAVVQGGLVGEQTFAKKLGVSRAPVRRALALLEARGVVRRQPGIGYVLINAGISALGESEALAPGAGERDLMTELLSDRASSRLKQEVSENELILHYGVSRGMVRKALQRLASENLVHRLRGHGWRFVDSLDTPAAIRESYAFRIEVECGALRQSSYKVNQGELNGLRSNHLRFLEREQASVRKEEWFRINADFHEALSAWSQNRYFLHAIRQQNSLRRMHQYAEFESFSAEEVQQSCRDHLAIMDALERADFPVAEATLRAHLQNAF